MSEQSIRILAVEMALGERPDYADSMHRHARTLLAEGTPIDMVVMRVLAAVISGVQAAYENPIDRAAALCWHLDQIPTWVYTPIPDATEN